MKKTPPRRTYGSQLVSHKSCIFGANLCGAGLLGQVACAVAGALSSASALLQACFFFAICIGTVVVGWCRFSRENAASAIQRQIDLGQIGVDDSLPTVEMQKTPSVFFYLVLCFAANGVPATLLLCGVWIPLVEDADPKGVIEDVIVLGIVLPLIGLIASWILSRRLAQASPKDRPNHKAQYLRLMRIYEGLANRNKVLAFALLGQIACVAAGALAGVSGFYQAAFFSAILFSAHNFGFYRILCEVAAQHMRSDLDDGVIQDASAPQFAHSAYLLMLDQDVYLFSIMAAPFTLFAGICTALFFPPFFYTTAYLSSILVGASIFGFLKSWWKLRRFKTLWTLCFR